MTDTHKNLIQQEQLTDLQAKLKRLNTHITQTEQFLAANPNHQPTLNRHNILCHDKSETLTKIRRLEEKMTQ